MDRAAEILGEWVRWSSSDEACCDGRGRPHARRRQGEGNLRRDPDSSCLGTGVTPTGTGSGEYSAKTWDEWQ